MKSLSTRLLGCGLLAICFLGLSRCDDWLLGTDPQHAPLAIFDRFWEDIDRYYSHFPLKEVDWRDVRAELRPEASRATTEAELFDLLCSMVVRLRDGHVNLYAQEPLRTCGYEGWYAGYPHNFSPAIIREGYLRDEAGTAGQGRYTYGHLEPNIGYIHISRFEGTGWVEDVDLVLAELQPLDALVLDVRDNGGGSSNNADALAGRFADQRHVHSYVQYRSGPAHDDFTAPAARYVEPAGIETFAGPVAVLTNRRCFSACESFLLAMDALPNTTVVGDTTGGGLGNPLYRELQNGWSFRVPVWLQTTPEGKALEGTGFPPHHPVHMTDADREQDRDTILDTALEVLTTMLQP